MNKQLKLEQENEILKEQLARVRDALCPSSLGTDMATWRAIIERQEQYTFNEFGLSQALGRKNGQTIMIVWQRYKDAVQALNGDEP